MMTNWNNKVLYAGVTDNLECRVYEDKDKLVYFEYTSDVNSAIAREKQIKGWTRQKKNEIKCSYLSRRTSANRFKVCT